MLTISRQLQNVLVCPAGIATNWWHKRNESYNEFKA